MNSLVNQAKLPTTEEFHAKVEKNTSKNGVVDMTKSGNQKNNSTVKEKGQPRNSPFVKVNMDGFPIGRKVDLNAHSCYETLAQALEHMFCGPTTTGGLRRELLYSLIFWSEFQWLFILIRLIEFVH